MAFDSDWDGIGVGDALDTLSESRYSDDGFDDFDTEGVDAGEVGSGRIEASKDGFHHFEFDAKAKPQRYKITADCPQGDMTKPVCPHVLVTCTVMAGPSPEGSVHYHQVILMGKGGDPIDENSRKATLNFLVGCGILKKVDGKIIDPNTGTAKIDSKTLEARLKGLQVVGKLEWDNPKDPKYAPRLRFNFGRGVFPVDDPAVKFVPKNLAALKAIGKEHAMPDATPQKNAPDKKDEKPNPANQNPSGNPNGGVANNKSKELAISPDL